MPTIKLSPDSIRFYQGVAAANEIHEAHADIKFPDFDTCSRAFWFYAGVLAGGKYGCATDEDFAAFTLGASTRAPALPVEEDSPECPEDGDTGYPSGEDGLWLCCSCGRELTHDEDED